MYKHQKKYREAVRFYERVKAKCDLEVSVYVDMAQCYHELGNRVESKRLLFQASKIENASQGEVIDLLKKYSFEEWCVCLMGNECVVCLSHNDNSMGYSHSGMVAPFILLLFQPRSFTDIKYKRDLWESHKLHSTACSLSPLLFLSSIPFHLSRLIACTHL